MMDKPKTPQVPWMMLGILVSLLVGSVWAGMLWYQGLSRVLITRGGVTFAYIHVEVPSNGRVQPGYIGCGKTAWGGGFSHELRSYRRGPEVVYEYREYYGWPPIFDRFQ
jgi:hypothetical protein